MEKETATLIAAIIAASAAIMNAVLVGWRQSNLEQKKWQRSRKDEDDKWRQNRQDEADTKLRAAISELARNITSGGQAIAWLTWKASRTPQLLTPKDISEYNTDMKMILPNIMSTHLLVVALDRTMGNSIIKPLVHQLYALDVKVALATLKLEESREEGILQLQTYSEESDTFYKELYEQLANVICAQKLTKNSE